VGGDRVMGGELMGSPPPDRDPRPKLALTFAPDPQRTYPTSILLFYW
jgi:hypothetical protein